MMTHPKYISFDTPIRVLQNHVFCLLGKSVVQEKNQKWLPQKPQILRPRFFRFTYIRLSQN